MKTPRAQDITRDWSMLLLRRAFRDLAASFAAIDSAAADRAIATIETAIAAELGEFLQKLPEGVTLDRATMTDIVGPLREMTQEARALIQQAGKPKQ